MRALFLLGAATLVACSGGPTVIRGKVVDHRGEPVSRAEVSTLPDTDIVVSNAKGFFVLRQRLNELGETEPIPPGKYTIKVKKFGFEDLNFEINLEGGPARVADLVMKPRTPDIEETAPEQTEEQEHAPDEANTPKIGI
jgi:hypothetical protein